MALAHIVSGVVVDEMNLRGGVGLLGMEALPQACDQRINLHGIDTRGSMAQRGSYIIARSGADNQDAIHAAGKLEGAVIGRVLIVACQLRVPGQRIGADVGDRHIALVVDQDVVLLIAGLHQGELLVGRPVDRAAVCGFQCKQCNSQQNTGYQRRAPGDGLREEDEGKGKDEPIRGWKPEIGEDGQKPDSRQTAQQVDRIGRHGVGRGFKIVANPTAQRDHGDGNQHEESQDHKQGKREVLVVLRRRELERAAPERGVGREGENRAHEAQHSVPGIEGQADGSYQYGRGCQRGQQAAALVGGEAANAEAQKADHEREILKEGEDLHLRAEPADQDDLQKQATDADQQKTPHGKGLRGLGRTVEFHYGSFVERTLATRRTRAGIAPKISLRDAPLIAESYWAVKRGSSLLIPCSRSPSCRRR